ncbi:MAG: helix-turn-helix transcriptional regulator [Anaerolineaceae bacterium]
MAATLVRDARASAGLSLRSLAERAGVATSTVLRIEAGQVDPTVGMLARLVGAAGQELEVATRRSPGPEIASLADAWKESTRGDRPDWTRLRAFVDHLTLHPEQKAAATLRMPAPSGSAVMDTLLAGIAEKICNDAGLPRPPWVRRVPPLPQQWVTPGTPGMQKAAKAATPRELAARGLSIDEHSVWREPGSVGA